jgi:hypothetical protein
MDENEMKLMEIKWLVLCALNFLGQELPEPFGAIIKDTKRPIFCLPGKYFTGDGALRDEVGYYRITGR